MEGSRSFAGDVSPEEAAFMADSQVPWGVDAPAGTITERVEVETDVVSGFQ
jgi:hypothetical protein